MDSYRFGFQGQEKDDEIFSSEGTSYSAQFWQYDSRIGRRWNLDPVVKYHESPYATFYNNPIFLIDPKGDDVINGDRLIANKKKGKMDKATKELSNFNENHKVEGAIKRKTFLGLGNSKKEWKKYKELRKNAKIATREFEAWDERAEITQNIIKQWQESAPNLFHEVDKQSTDFILSSFKYKPSIHKAFGSTTPAYIGAVTDAKAPPAMRIRIAEQVNIYSFDTETGEYSLNHEAGHFLYIVKFTAEYVKYYFESKKNGTYVSGGHGETDESGKVAKKYGALKDIPSPAPVILRIGN